MKRTSRKTRTLKLRNLKRYAFIIGTVAFGFVGTSLAVSSSANELDPVQTPVACTGVYGYDNCIYEEQDEQTNPGACTNSYPGYCTDGPTPEDEQTNPGACTNSTPDNCTGDSAVIPANPARGNGNSTANPNAPASNNETPASSSDQNSAALANGSSSSANQNSPLITETPKKDKGIGGFFRKIGRSISNFFKSLF